MPEFTNTHEQNYNVLITIIELYELLFTSGAGSGCAKKAVYVCLCMLCKESKVPSHFLSPGVVVLLRLLLFKTILAT